MPVSMEPFSSTGHFLTYNPFPPISAPIQVSRLECPSCGFEPSGIVPPDVCPRCHKSVWARLAYPGSVLDNESRYIKIRATRSQLKLHGRPKGRCTNGS